MLHVVPMFFYNCLRKPDRTSSNDNDVSMEELMEAAAEQLRDLDSTQQHHQQQHSDCDVNFDSASYPSFRNKDGSMVKENQIMKNDNICPNKSSPRQYEPMQKVPFVSLDINLDDTEGTGEDDGDENDTDELDIQEKYIVKEVRRTPHTRTTSATVQTKDESLNEAKTPMMIVESSSSLLDLLSSNKELSASKAVVDLVARVADPESAHHTNPTTSSPGSPVSGAPPPMILHRTPIPTEIFCESLPIMTVDESESSDDTSCSEEIMDPTDALIYGWIDNTYLRDISERMNDYLAAAEDDDITSLCRATTTLMSQHPMSCQVKYRPPEFSSFCYPLSYFSAAGWLEGCKAAYDAFPEAIGQENDNQIGLPLHYACLHQASFDVVQYLVETYPEAARVTNAEHQTPLHCVCRSKDCKLEVVELLLKHYPTAAQLADRSGFTPFHLACKFGASLEVLVALQASSPTVIRGVTLKWHRPLHIAVMHGANLPTVRWLLSRDPSAIRATTEDFSTVLHYAVAGRCEADVVQILRDSHPSALSLTNDEDETPHDVGARCQSTDEVLRLLIPQQERQQ